MAFKSASNLLLAAGRGQIQRLGRMDLFRDTVLISGVQTGVADGFEHLRRLGNIRAMWRRANVSSGASELVSVTNMA